MSLREVSPRGSRSPPSCPRAPSDPRAGRRERQTEDARHLVERLACRVVDRAAERSHVVGDVRHEQQAGVAAGDEHRQRRLRQRAVLDDVHRDVGGEVVHAVQRDAERTPTAPWPPPRRRAGRRPGRGRRSRRSRRGRRAGCRHRGTRARSSAPSPPGAPGWPPPARRRRSARARRRCSRRRRPAAARRGRSRPRSRRRRSRCPAPGARRRSSSVLQVQPHDVRVDVTGLVVLASRRQGHEARGGVERWAGALSARTSSMRCSAPLSRASDTRWSISRRPQPRPCAAGRDRDRHHVGDLAGPVETGVARDLPVVLGHDVGPAGRWASSDHQLASDQASAPNSSGSSAARTRDVVPRSSRAASPDRLHALGGRHGVRPAQVERLDVRTGRRRRPAAGRPGRPAGRALTSSGPTRPGSSSG